MAAEVGWSIVLAANADHMSLAAGLMIAVEYLRDLAWALVLMRCLGRPQSSRVARIAQRSLIVLVAAVVLWAAGSLLPGEPGLLALQIARYWLWGGFLLAIAGLVRLSVVHEKCTESLDMTDVRCGHRTSMTHRHIERMCISASRSSVPSARLDRGE